MNTFDFTQGATNKPLPFTVEVRVYRQAIPPTGRKDDEVPEKIVEERIPVIGTPPAGYTRFWGRGTIVARQGAQVMREDIEFPIDADTIEEAFTEHTAASQRAVETFRRMMSRPRIELPG